MRGVGKMKELLLLGVILLVCVGVYVAISGLYRFLDKVRKDKMKDME